MDHHHQHQHNHLHQHDNYGSQLLHLQQADDDAAQHVDGGGGSQQQSQGASQPDILTQQLHQVLVADTARFWTTTVAPSTAAIAQCTAQLQSESAALNNRAESELQGLLDELARVHGLVASFQDQIRETLSLLQG